MSVETQLVPIRMAKGLDTKADSKSAPTGDLDALTNATFQAPGKIIKRNGYDALTQQCTTAAGLATRGSELLLMDGTNAYSYEQANDEWTNKGPLPSPTVTVGPGIQAGGSSVIGYDCAQHSNGLRMMAAELWSPVFGGVGATCSGVVYSIVDTLTGNTIVSQTLVSASVRNPKVIVAGGNFLLYVTNSTSLVLYPLDVTTPTATLSGTTVATVSSTTLNYDVTYSAQWGLILLASCNNTGTPTNGVQTQTFLAATPTVQNSTATIASVSARTVAICFDPTYGGSVWLAWITSASTISYYMYSNTALTTSPLGGAGTLATATGATALTLVPAPSTATNVANGFSFVLCYYTVPDASFLPFGGGTTNGNGRDKVRVVVVQAYDAIGAAQTLLLGARLAGKGFTQGPLYDIPWIYSPGNYIQAQTPYVPAIFAAGTSSTTVDPTSTLFLVQGITGQAVVRMWQGTSAAMWFNSTCGVNTVPGMLPECTSLGGGSCVLAAGEVTQFSSPAITSAAPVLYSLISARAVTIDFADPVYGFEGAEIAGMTLFSGGCPTAYDGGRTTVEHGFNYSPHRLQATAYVTGGTGLTAGTYSYTAIYEWVAANGIIHWSGAAAAVSVTITGTTSRVALVCPTLRMTSKTGVRVVWFRTLVNGSVYYRLNNTGGASANDVLLNSTTVDYVDYTDSSVTDTVLASRAQLYTTGGVLENDPPPPLLCPVVHRRRVVGIDASNRNTLWYAKQVSEGTPVEFSLSFVLSVSPAGGDSVACASLDDKLIVWKADRIFMFTGQGPDSTGGQLDWSDSILVSSDTGCNAPKSIVTTPGGILFQGAKGIYRLGRDLSVSYIGGPVEAYNAQPVLGACLMADVQQVRFTQAAQTLVYDYGVGQWSVYALPGTGVDSLVWQGVHTHVRSTGVVVIENSTHHHDPGSTFVPMSFLTSWISLAGLQGFQRVRRLLLAGMQGAQTEINVSIASDYDPENQWIGGCYASSAQAVTFSPTSTNAGNWQERIHVRRQKCEAIQIGFVETQSGAVFDAYLDLSAISLEVGIKRGANKMPAALSVG